MIVVSGFGLPSWQSKPWLLLTKVEPHIPRAKSGDIFGNNFFAALDTSFPSA
jgi:hypothetical protein